MRGRKMAKSAGNFQRITELVDDGFDPLAFRYICLTARYSRKLDYSEASLAASAAALASLRDRLASLGPAPIDGPWAAPPPLVAGRAPDRPAGLAPGVAGHGSTEGLAEPALLDRAHSPAAPLSPAGAEAHARFVMALDDDLDLPRALAEVRAIVRSDLAADERRWLVLDADFVLGLDLHRAATTTPISAPAWQPSAAATALLAERQAARARRDYARADAIREELEGMGVTVVDRSDGTSEARPAGD
jgi:cysteinyl-tRNA synthetase